MYDNEFSNEWRKGISVSKMTYRDLTPSLKLSWSIYLNPVLPACVWQGICATLRKAPGRCQGSWREALPVNTLRLDFWSIRFFCTSFRDNASNTHLEINQPKRQQVREELVIGTSYFWLYQRSPKRTGPHLKDGRICQGGVTAVCAWRGWGWQGISNVYDAKN